MRAAHLVGYTEFPVGFTNQQNERLNRGAEIIISVSYEYGGVELIPRNSARARAHLSFTRYSREKLPRRDISRSARLSE